MRGIITNKWWLNKDFRAHIGSTRKTLSHMGEQMVELDEFPPKNGGGGGGNDPGFANIFLKPLTQPGRLTFKLLGSTNI